MKTFKAGAVALIATIAVVPGAEAAKKSSTKYAPGKEFASALKKELPRLTGVKTRTATCPKKVRNKKGTKVTCKVTFVSGDSVRVRITLTDTNGGFKPRLHDMMMRNLEQQLRGTIKDFQARIVCPKARLVQRADSFTCDIYKERSLVGFYDLTQIGDGRVRFNPPRSADANSTPANPVPADL